MNANSPPDEPAAGAPQIRQSGIAALPLGGQVTATILASLLVAAVYLGWLALDQFVLRHTPLAVQLGLTLALVGTGAIGTYFLYARVSGRSPALPRRTPQVYKDRLIQLLTGIGYPAVAFVSATALLLRHKTLISATGVSSDGSGLVYATLETYAWSIVNAVPSLDLTETFGWHPSLHLTNEWGRVLILGFKLALILPLFQMIGKLVQRWVWRSLTSEPQPPAAYPRSAAK